MHLTNVSVQKHQGGYSPLHGGKWGLDELRLFLEASRGERSADLLFQRMEALLVHSLFAVQSKITSYKQCFEVFGFDVLIDEDLRPWLLEVNASPSLTATTEDDFRVKQAVVVDTIQQVMLDKRGVPPQPGVITHATELPEKLHYMPAWQVGDTVAPASPTGEPVSDNPLRAVGVPRSRGRVSAPARPATGYSLLVDEEKGKFPGFGLG